MKKNLIVLLIVLIVLSFCIFLYTIKNKNTTINNQQTSFIEPSERFVGNIDGNRIVFEQKDYTKYTLQINNTTTSGSLNTERGFGSDVDATVYVLNWDKPETEQKYYVRLTGDQAHIQLLDSSRKIIPGALLQREK